MVSVFPLAHKRREDESQHDAHSLAKYLSVLKPTFSILSSSARSFCLLLYVLYRTALWLHFRSLACIGEALRRKHDWCRRLQRFQETARIHVFFQRSQAIMPQKNYAATNDESNG